MGCVANPPANGSRPSNCSCPALFLDAIIHRTSNSFPRLDQPDMEMMSSKASEIYWKLKSSQLSCELDCSLPLPPCMAYVIGPHIKAVGQSLLSIALDLDATVLMSSSDDEEAPLHVPVQENPSMQEEESKGEQGPILTRSTLKRQCINQPQNTMTQYYGPPEEQKNKKENKKGLYST
jgi:hypothetical protein